MAAHGLRAGPAEGGLQVTQHINYNDVRSYDSHVREQYHNAMLSRQAPGFMDAVDEDFLEHERAVILSPMGYALLAMVCAIDDMLAAGMGIPADVQNAYVLAVDRIMLELSW